MEIVKLLNAKLFGKYFPHAVQFNIGYHCNLRCTYCASYQDRTPEMSTSQILRMIDEFADMGTARLSITGGEPLLRRDLPEIIHHARNRGLYVSVATNGSFIPQRLDYLKEANIVCLTLDGPEEIHDKQRGKGNFKCIMESIRSLRSKNIPFYLISVLTKNNCCKIGEILEIVKSLDTKVVIQPVFYNEHSHAHDLEGYEESRYDDCELMDTLDYLIEQKKQGNHRIILSQRYYRNVKEAIRTDSMIVCKNGGKQFCTISPEGKVTPCNLLVRETRWLNGNDAGFNAAYKNMPQVNCDGCISSLIDFDDIYNLKPDVVLNYLNGR